MYGNKTNKKQRRKEGFIAGTLKLHASLNKGGSKEISHALLLSKVRGMVKTWKRFATRKELHWKLFLVLSDWSESKRCKSDLHVHFLLYSSAASLSGAFFQNWWSSNSMGGFKQVLVKPYLSNRKTTVRFPIDFGWFNYVRENYRFSTHKNKWELCSDSLVNHSWLMLDLPERVNSAEFLGLTW